MHSALLEGSQGYGVAPRVHEAVALLWQASRYAQELERTVWDFAVEIESLAAAGLTNSDLRWLVCKGYVEHRREITMPGEDGRCFHYIGNLTFDERTCFVLTEPGTLFARQVCGEPAVLRGLNNHLHSRDGTDLAGPGSPHWDRDRQQLRVGNTVVKQFKTPAPNQELILAAFQEENWPPRIDDPLPPNLDQDGKRRLHDSINCLNRNQKHFLIHFMGDGSGEGIRWELVQGQPTSRLQSGATTPPHSQNGRT